LIESSKCDENQDNLSQYFKQKPPNSRSDKILVNFKKRIDASAIAKSIKGEEQQSDQVPARKISEEIKNDLPQNSEYQSIVCVKSPELSTTKKTNEEVEAKYIKLYDKYVWIGYV
jgi:hypothetical protein